jgi:DNA-binding SARP family transcriptional activator
MRVRVLGELEILLDGHLIDLGGPKPRALTGLLVAAEGRPVPVDYLVDQIWGESPPSRVEASLQSYVARLRRALHPAGSGRGTDRVLRTHAGAYSIDLDGALLDARRFIDLLTEARSASGDARVGLLDQALGLWRGSAYAGLGCPALEAEAVRLDELRMTAVEESWALRLARGEEARAAAELEQLVRMYPLRERLWALLARALYAGDRQGDALAALRRAREHLAEEIGVDPGPELRRLEEAVLRQDPALEAAAPAVAVAPVMGVGPAVPETVPADRRLAIYGRDRMLAAVDAVLDGAASGAGATVVVAGAPGVGKTRLLDAVVASARARGFRIGRAGWEDRGAPPLWAWTRAVTGLLGNGEVLESEVSDATTASFRRADALVDAVRAGPPCLVVLDDLHWADADSLRLLRRVAAGAGTVPLVVVVATRSAEAEVPAPLAEALVALARTGALRLDLAGLDATAVREWVGDQAGVPLSDETAERLVERTGGNPFYVTELLRLLLADDALSDPDADAWRAVPTGVRDVVRQRLAVLEGDAATVVGVAATVGRSFDLDVVATASGQPVEVVEQAVGTLEGLGLVEGAGPGRVQFTHALVRDAVHSATPVTARSRRHGLVAAALEKHHHGRVAEHAAELAEHYRLAGPAHARSGWLFAALAAEQAGERSAHDDALRWWQQAEELVARDPAATEREQERLLLGRARALVGLARGLDAWPPVAAAATSALNRDDIDAAAAALLTITDDLVWGWRLHPSYDQDAIDLWGRVRAQLERSGGDVVVWARLTAALALECFFKPGMEVETTRLAEEALTAVRRATADPVERMKVVQLALAAMLRPEHQSRRLALHDELVELATRASAPSRLSTALAGRAADLGESGRLEAARSDVVRARDLAERHRLSENLLVTGWAEALLLQVDERWSEAEVALDRLDAFEATLATPGRGITLAQRAVLRELFGRLPELRETLGAVAGFHPFFREMYAVSLVRSGDREGARRWLGPWLEQPPLPRDYLWTATTTVRSWVWVALRDAEAVADLRRQLTPYADRLVYGSATVAFLGSLHLWVGELAAADGDRAAARQHLDEALATHRRLGLPFWTVRVEQSLLRLDDATA